jgi:hypothetical protein
VLINFKIIANIKTLVNYFFLEAQSIIEGHGLRALITIITVIGRTMKSMQKERIGFFFCVQNASNKEELEL